MASGATGDYRIYSDLADWWPMISPTREYAQEAAYLAAIINQAKSPGATDRATVLDLGSGGGHVAVHLTDMFTVTLVDISDQMLAVSRRLNPECEHHADDMRTVRLGRRFDAVLVHDAIDYIIGAADLRQVIQTAAAHCKPNGVALFVPDYVKDTFREVMGGGGGGVDEAGRTASFVERTWDPDPADDWVQADYEFTLHTPDGRSEVVAESHRLSAFSRDTWLSLLAEAGLTQDLDIDHQQNSAGQPGQRPAHLFATRLLGPTASHAGRRPRGDNLGR